MAFPSTTPSPRLAVWLFSLLTCRFPTWHTRAHVHKAREMTDRESSLEVAAHLHRSAQRVPVLTSWEHISLGTCLTEGGELTHSLCKQAHMAIIALIFGGGVGEKMLKSGVRGARSERKMKQ